MFTISTGEPPTPPVTTQRSPISSANTTSEPKPSSHGLEDSGRVASDFEDSGRVPSDFEDSGRIPSSGCQANARTRSDLEDSGRIPSDFEDSGRMPQELDSGYEASPCSIADTSPTSLHFFGDEERPDDVFDDFVILGAADDDDDEDCVDCGPNCRCNESSSAAETVLDGDLSNCGPNCRCNSRPCADCGPNCRCPCNSRPESSSAAETVLDGDLSNCDSTSSDSSTHHPSSLPIRIPARVPSSHRTRQAQVTSYSPVVFPFHPRSCPVAWLGQSSPLPRMTSDAEWLRRRASLQNQRRRRLQIDSDASSNVDSSDDNFLSDDGLDNEVFRKSLDLFYLFSRMIVLFTYTPLYREYLGVHGN